MGPAEKNVSNALIKLEGIWVLTEGMMGASQLSMVATMPKDTVVRTASLACPWCILFWRLRSCPLV